MHLEVNSKLSEELKNGIRILVGQVQCFFVFVFFLSYGS